jgi:hypothetical protein
MKIRRNKETKHYWLTVWWLFRSTNCGHQRHRVRARVQNSSKKYEDFWDTKPTNKCTSQNAV